MVPKASAGGHEPGVLPLAQMSGTAARLIDRLGYVGSLAVNDSKLSLEVGVADHDKGPALGVAARWRADSRVKNSRDELFRHRIGFEAADQSRRIDRLE